MVRGPAGCGTTGTVGLTVRNLGVEGPLVPGVAPERRAEPVAVPAMAGWTWLTLRGVPDEDGLDAEVAIAAAATGARALAYAVDDSDDAYVVGAVPAGVAFRLRLEEEEGQLPE